MTLAERIAQHDARPDPNGRDNCAQCGRPIRHDATDLRPTVRGTLYRYAHDIGPTCKRCKAAGR